MNEIVITSSFSINNLSESIHIWDLKSGKTYNSLKNNNCEINCLGFIGNDYILSYQKNSTILHYWIWKKNQLYLKSSLPEKISSLKVSNDGIYCIVGGLSGTAYIWEISTGILIQIWEAHYKKITSIIFTDDDSMIITGGEDGIINLWLISDIINFDKNKDHQQIEETNNLYKNTIKPFHSFNQHSLPITNLIMGLGGINGRLISTSLDRTCKVINLLFKMI
jgi:pre-rRNA-processing protein IPI3